MGRRKKRANLKLALLGLALLAAGWFGADFFNGNFGKAGQPPAAAPEQPPAADEPVATPESEKMTDGGNDPQFVLETYRNDKYGFELQYPVLKNGAPGCPSLQENADGFSLGIFNFTAYETAGRALADFVADELAGMNIETRTALAIADKPAARIDYQTTGMGFSGSSVFLEHGGYFFEFGLLVNTAPAVCGGQTGYEDKVYQSVISSLKFAD